MMNRASVFLLVLLSMAATGAVACDAGGEEEIDTVTQLACNCDTCGHCCCCTTPIVLDIAGDGIELTSWKDGVVFELKPERFGPWAWTGKDSDDAWLVLDNSGEGLIEHGSEMFGDIMPQPKPADGGRPNGFNALAQHDTNGDRVVDAKDEIWTELRLWQDRDHDGKSTEEELHTLEDLGVAGISVDYAEHRKPDGLGNVFRYSAAVIPAAGATVGMTAWDVVLASATGKDAVTNVERAAPMPGSWTELRKALRARQMPNARVSSEGVDVVASSSRESDARRACAWGVHLHNPHMDSGRAATYAYWYPGSCSATQAEVEVDLYQETTSGDRLIKRTNSIVPPNLKVWARAPVCYPGSGDFWALVDVDVLGIFDLPDQPFTDTIPLPCNAIPPDCPN